MRSKPPRKRHQQLPLDRARRPPKTHGGWRPGAGRKPKPGAVSHDPRPALASRFPQHVTLRLAEGMPSIARDWLMKIVREAIRKSHKGTFRIVEFNVLANHLHLITEAAGKRQLACGMQGLEVRLARSLNSALKRTGKLFAHRYHVRCLQTPIEVRHALRYVLLNRKHHDAEKRFAKSWIDPYSSAAWFTGWAEAIRTDTDWKRELVAMESPTARPTVWLLTTGWHRHHGRLRFDDRPS